MVKDVVVAGIDIGGTNTVCGLTDKSGAILAREGFKTNSCSQFPHFVEKVASSVTAMAGRLGVSFAGIGIGAPNANYYTGEINDAANLLWKGTLHLKRDMEAATGVPVTITNDANAAAVGEMIFGAARGMKDFIMLTLGTGVGSGIVANGRVVYGKTGLAGELGHVIMTDNGRSCGCGRKGCLEAYASATGVARTAVEFLARPGVKSSLSEITGSEINSWHVARHAEAGDPVALEVFDFTARMLALAITNAVLFSSPEAIILAGGLAKSGNLLKKPLEKYVEEFIMPNFRNSFKIISTGLPESDAAILGAAALVINQ
ncbi:MAG: ROK family protein [Bacteroidales bacterium]|nr:ROK family protein [Bacteroidales bacterium]